MSSLQSDDKNRSRDASADDWPPEGLEYLGACPGCGSKERTLLHAVLKDKVFFCAPGTWQMWRCNRCRSGYLDPRPDEKTISLAYAAYYTHEQAPSVQPPKPPGWFSRLKKQRWRFRVGYFNAKYGHNLPGDLGPANILSTLLPRFVVQHWDYHIRHLPKANPGDRLVDIGCGNGSFLRVADNLGYRVMGLEVDPGAIEACKKAGFEVQQGMLPKTGLPVAAFQQITLNHVIEHVHDPRATLDEVFSLLKPGGRVWLQLPNIDALGHDLYQDAWRGLEPPRHLVMQPFQALQDMMQSVGFKDVSLLPPSDVFMNFVKRSEVILSHLGHKKEENPIISKEVIRKALRDERRMPERNERLTITGYKP